MPKAFGNQGFLNPPGSEDSGWWKFSARRSAKKLIGRVTAVTIIADCTRQINLDFEVWGVDKTAATNANLKVIQKDIKSKRVKIEKFRKAVNAYADALNVIYDEALEEVNQALAELQNKPEET